MADLGTLSTSYFQRSFATAVTTYDASSYKGRAPGKIGRSPLATVWQTTRGTVTGSAPPAMQKSPLDVWQQSQPGALPTLAMKSLVIPVPWWIPGGSALSAKSSSFSSVVRRDGSTIGGATVRMYDRRSGMHIATTISAADGSYSFHDLNADFAQSYFIVAFDPNTVAPYNAVVYDLLTPG